MLRDGHRELTHALPLGVDCTPTLTRFLVHKEWHPPTDLLEFCLQSRRQPTLDETIRQMLLLQPELMGEWATSFRFLRVAPGHWVLGQLGGPGRRLRVYFRQMWHEVRVPRFERVGPALLSQPPCALTSHAHDMTEWILYLQRSQGWYRVSPLAWAPQVEHSTRLHLYRGGLSVEAPYTLTPPLRGGSTCSLMLCHRAWGADLRRPWRMKVQDLKEAPSQVLTVEGHRIKLTKASRHLEDGWTLKVA